MVVEKLPEVNPPSGRVPGQDRLAVPILELRRRRNRGTYREKGSVPRVFGTRGKYRRKGAAIGGPGCPGAPWRDLGWGRATMPPGHLVGPLSGHPEASVSLIFYIFFQEFLEHFK